jgi:beta-lactamase regulating signal transducer with metallopeptidase domain
VMQLHAISAALTWALGDNHGGLSAAFAQFARAASPVALDAMWQGAAVAIVLFISLRLAPRVSAAHRFAAWTAGFAALSALPLLPIIAHLFAGSGAASSSASIVPSAHAWLELDSRWALAIAAFWLIASALRLAQFVFDTRRLRRLWKTATPIADQSPIASLSAGRAEICTTRQLDRPSVIGFFAPRILIPEWLYARLTPQELQQVVYHEVEHLRRHDDWTNLIQKLVLVLFPLNPALAWIERRLCREREMACDEGVVRKTQAPRAYAACLASLAERGLARDRERELARRGEALSLAAWRRRPELVHRVHGILGRKPVLNPVAARALLGTVACGLLVGSVELARCPQAVAFVAAPAPQIAGADANPGAVNLDRVAYAPSGAAALAQSESGFHMVQAKAILPATRNQAMNSAQTHHAAARPAAALDTEIASRDAAIATPHETLLKAEMPAAATQAARPEQSTQQQPQYFVLTAVEQVQMIPQNSREIADYDTGGANDQASPAAQQSQNANGKPAAAPAPQVTITRLIFRISPAGAQASSTSSTATGANHAPSTKSAPTSHPTQQPAIIPIGNGWLVLQL